MKLKVLGLMATATLAMTGCKHPAAQPAPSRNMGLCAQIKYQLVHVPSIGYRAGSQPNTAQRAILLRQYQEYGCERP